MARPPIHPGEILADELEEIGLQSTYELDLARRQKGRAIRRIPKRNEAAEPRRAA